MNQRQRHGQQRLYDVGSEQRLVHTDPTDELLLLKLLRKFMPALIERCQSTQFITVCCTWDCRPARVAGGHNVILGSVYIN